ncbi:hypothetical protein [Nocardia thraciensis]
MTTTEGVQWGVLVDRVVRPIPTARTAADAWIYVAALKNRMTKKTVVYRNSDQDMWRTWLAEAEQPTQMSLDLPDTRRRAV